MKKISTPLLCTILLVLVTFSQSFLPYRNTRNAFGLTSTKLSPFIQSQKYLDAIIDIRGGGPEDQSRSRSSSSPSRRKKKTKRKAKAKSKHGVKSHTPKRKKRKSNKRVGARSSQKRGKSMTVSTAAKGVQKKRKKKRSRSKSKVVEEVSPSYGQDLDEQVDLEGRGRESSAEVVATPISASKSDSVSEPVKRKKKKKKTKQRTFVSTSTTIKDNSVSEPSKRNKKKKKMKGRAIVSAPPKGKNKTKRKSAKRIVTSHDAIPNNDDYDSNVIREERNSIQESPRKSSKKMKKRKNKMKRRSMVESENNHASSMDDPTTPVVAAPIPIDDGDDATTPCDLFLPAEAKKVHRKKKKKKTRLKGQKSATRAPGTGTVTGDIDSSGAEMQISDAQEDGMNLISEMEESPQGPNTSMAKKRKKSKKKKRTSSKITTSAAEHTEIGMEVAVEEDEIGIEVAVEDVESGVHTIVSDRDVDSIEDSAVEDSNATIVKPKDKKTKSKTRAGPLHPAAKEATDDESTGTNDTSAELEKGITPLAATTKNTIDSDAPEVSVEEEEVKEEQNLAAPEVESMDSQSSAEEYGDKDSSEEMAEPAAHDSEKDENERIVRSRSLEFEGTEQISLKNEEDENDVVLEDVIGSFDQEKEENANESTSDENNDTDASEQIQDEAADGDRDGEVSEIVGSRSAEVTDFNSKLEDSDNILVLEDAAEILAKEREARAVESSIDAANTEVESGADSSSDEEDAKIDLSDEKDSFIEDLNSSKDEEGSGDNGTGQDETSEEEDRQMSGDDSTDNDDADSSSSHDDESSSEDNSSSDEDDEEEIESSSPKQSADNEEKEVQTIDKEAIDDKDGDDDDDTESSNEDVGSARSVDDSEEKEVQIIDKESKDDDDTDGSSSDDVNNSDSDTSSDDDIEEESTQASSKESKDDDDTDGSSSDDVNISDSDNSSDDDIEEEGTQASSKESKDDDDTDRSSSDDVNSSDSDTSSDDDNDIEEEGAQASGEESKDDDDAESSDKVANAAETEEPDKELPEQDADNSNEDSDFDPDSDEISDNVKPNEAIVAIEEIQNNEFEISDKFEGDSNENAEAENDVVVASKDIGFDTKRETMVESVKTERSPDVSGGAVRIILDKTRGTNAESNQECTTENAQLSEDSQITCSVITWNLAESSPSEDEAAFIRKFRGTKGSGSDFVVFGAQETENTKPRRSEGSRSVEIRRLLIKMLGKKYVPLALHSLGGVQFALFCKRSIVGDLEHVSIADVACGIGNVFHNKGAIGAFVQMKARNGNATDDCKKRAKSVKMLLVSCHLVSMHAKSSFLFANTILTMYILFTHPRLLMSRKSMQGTPTTGEL